MYLDYSEIASPLDNQPLHKATLDVAGLTVAALVKSKGGLKQLVLGTSFNQVSMYSIP